MHGRLFSAALAGIGTYSAESDQGEKRVAHSSGALVRYVDLSDSSGQSFRLPVGEDVDLEVVERGDLVDVDVDVRIDPRVAYSRTGREYVQNVTKMRVQAIAPVATGAKA